MTSFLGLRQRRGPDEEALQEGRELDRPRWRLPADHLPRHRPAAAGSQGRAARVRPGQQLFYTTGARYGPSGHEELELSEAGRNET